MPAKAYLWNRAPALRLLLPLIAGILFQWHLGFTISFLNATIAVILFFSITYGFLSTSFKFRLRIVHGILLHVLVGLSGCFFVTTADVRNNKNWIGKNAGTAIILRLKEPLIEKAKSYKAIAEVENIYVNGQLQKGAGKVIIYFKKDSSLHSLDYGSRLVIGKKLQAIKNAGNPGSFDYQQYSLLNGITHQVYLTEADYKLLATSAANSFHQFLLQSRQGIIRVIRENIPGEKEQGLAEALLIGYKDDLDKDLLQSYSNTGVVHVIAISGLHLGLIYLILMFLTRPLHHKKMAWLRFLIIITSLWLFSFLAGAQPSILRAAVMFSFIAAGKVINRQTSIYHTLSLSAFLLLCYNPFWLWDVGFQLSYAAVLSIIIFYKPIYNWLYIQNKSLDFLWKLAATSIAAQILTLPISIYHFHQFPVLFLFTNLLAVPLSSLILIGEIILCVLSFIQPVANFLGIALSFLIGLMNGFIEQADQVQFSVWGGLSINLLQALVLAAIIAGTSYWLMEKNKKALWLSLCLGLLFISTRSYSFWQAAQQKQLIVYNVQGHSAVDLIDGRHNYFVGDKALIQDEYLRNFHITPSRIVHRVINEGVVDHSSFNFYDRKILIIDKPVSVPSQEKPLLVDLLILSKNPKLYINTLIKKIQPKQVVADGSVPRWKAALWKKDCEALQIPFHSVDEKGAFVMKF